MKTILIIKLTILFTLIFSSQASLAQDQFETLVRKAQVLCPRLDCPDSEVKLQQVSVSEYRRLNLKTRDLLKKVGHHMAEILWPDTILEGPFFAKFNVRTDRVERVLYKGNQIGWRVTYSDQAWDIETCSFDDQDLKTLEACSTGRITESSFVSLDFSNEFRDESAYARFEH